MQRIRTHKNLIPLLLLALLSIYTVLTIQFVPLAQAGEAQQRIFTGAHFGAFGALLLNFLFYNSFRRFFKPLLVLTLLLTLLGIINFTAGFYQVSLAFNDANIEVSLVGVLLILLYYFLNRSRTHAFIGHYLGSLLPTPSPGQAARHQREIIDRFKATFARKSTESLRLIVEERKVVPAALEAAQQLLRERSVAATASGV